MTTPQTFQSLSALAFVKMKWVELRQAARRMGDKNAEARYSNWIADCQARGERIAAGHVTRHTPHVTMKEAA